MPTYCYETEDGEIREVYMTCEEMVNRQRKDGTIVLEDGKIGTRHMGAEQGGMVHGDIWRNHFSESLAVHPSQVSEVTEVSKKSGVNVEFDKAGRPKFDSQVHRRKFCKIFGYGENNCFLG